MHLKGFEGVIISVISLFAPTCHLEFFNKNKTYPPRSERVIFIFIFFIFFHRSSNLAWMGFTNGETPLMDSNFALGSGREIYWFFFPPQPKGGEGKYLISFGWLFCSNGNDGLFFWAGW